MKIEIGDALLCQYKRYADPFYNGMSLIVINKRAGNIEYIKTKMWNELLYSNYIENYQFDLKPFDIISPYFFGSEKESRFKTGWVKDMLVTGEISRSDELKNSIMKVKEYSENFPVGVDFVCTCNCCRAKTITSITLSFPGYQEEQSTICFRCGSRLGMNSCDGYLVENVTIISKRG